MKLITPAIMLFSLGAAKFWASALTTPIAGHGHGVTAPIDSHEVTAPINGYEITIPEWEVEVFPGGPFIKVNGTIQEVRRELLRHNPDWDDHYLTNITKESTSLNKRGFDTAGIICNGRWETCSANKIREGIEYLHHVPGVPSATPGARVCGRVSCSYNAAIWWCNDAIISKFLQGGFDDIADGATILVRECASQGGNFPTVAGQIFATSDWNIIVREDKC